MISPGALLVGKLICSSKGEPFPATARCNRIEIWSSHESDYWTLQISRRGFWLVMSERLNERYKVMHYTGDKRAFGWIAAKYVEDNICFAVLGEFQ